MSTTRALHFLPTHLGVRDPVLWGLNDIQVAKLGAGVLLATFVFRQTGLAVAPRLALAVLALLGAVASAFVRVDDRPIEDWLLLAGRYWARPRVLVWRPRRADHPWAQAAVRPRGTWTGDGARYCLRQIRVCWDEPARECGVAP
jgi:hypothetical protein